MLKLRDAIFKLYKKAATSLPTDVEAALRYAHAEEKERSNTKAALSVILENTKIARETVRPICQDTGVPVFFIKVPFGIRHLEIRSVIIEATRIATVKVPLRANAVDILTDKNSGDNTGIGFPVMYFEETKGKKLTIDLMLKGSGCENAGQLYKLPVEELKAELEKRLLKDINQLGIGPLGLGGKTTAIGVKIGVNHRHPASYFVDVSVCCWADRRARLAWKM